VLFDGISCQNRPEISRGEAVSLMSEQYKISSNHIHSWDALIAAMGSVESLRRHLTHPYCTKSINRDETGLAEAKRLFLENYSEDPASLTFRA
jgi:hypothetical protein